MVLKIMVLWKLSFLIKVIRITDIEVLCAN